MSKTNEDYFDSLPFGRLAVIPLQSCADFCRKVDEYLVEWRAQRSKELHHGIVFQGYTRDSYLISAECPRFGSGEAKGQLNESVRGDDIYILVDVTNYSCTYEMSGGIVNHMSPDDHYQDLKRIIAACKPNARRVNVIMPFLYESRQHRKSGRESLDCAMALQELVDMGVANIITFDAHDPRVANAIPLHDFESVSPAHQIIKALLTNCTDITLDSDHLMVVSPDEGGKKKAVYYANNLGVDMGMFYKRRDYSRIVDGANPIVAHEFLGSDIEGKDIIVIDDMIASGSSMFEVCESLKKRGARNIYLCATFGLFTKGMKKFDEFYEKGMFTKVITTNLVYQTEELLSRDYYISCDMTKYVAMLIDTLNHDSAVSGLLEPSERIQKNIKKYRATGTIVE